MAQEKPSDSYMLQAALEDVLQEEVERSWDSIRKDAIKKFDDQKPEIIAKISLSLTKHLDMQHLSDRLVLTIKFENNNHA